jgi:hypothetical protein
VRNLIPGVPSHLSKIGRKATNLLVQLKHDRGEIFVRVPNEHMDPLQILFADLPVHEVLRQGDGANRNAGLFQQR